MFGFILCIIRISLLPLSSTKKELMARVLLVEKENTILKRSLELKRKRPRFILRDRLFYLIFNRIADKTRYHFILVKPETVLKWIRRFIGSARREAFDWFILFNGAQIRNILDGYIGYYNEKRLH